MNNRTLAVKPEELHILQKIFKDHPGAFLFGSRINGKPKPYSDLDVCFIRQKPVPVLEMALLKEKCENSDLPFVVDIIDYHHVAKPFQKVIDDTKQPFPYLPKSEDIQQ